MALTSIKVRRIDKISPGPRVHNASVIGGQADIPNPWTQDRPCQQM
jgi:hypothetical protein